MRISDWSSDVCSSDLNRGGAVTARIEVDAQQGAQVRRKEITVQDGDDLEDETGRAVYKNCRIGEIRVSGDSSLLEVKTDGSETFLSVGEAIGDVDADAIKRLMIRRTIQEHLEKEKRSEEHTSELQSLMRTTYAVF